MKTNVKFLSTAEATKWITIANLFAQSLVPPQKALKQFNSLSANDKINIKAKFSEYDDIRRKKIPKGETDNAWIISVMVDAHIIATEYNIDPLTGIMCLSPPCKPNEKIIIK